MDGHTDNKTASLEAGTMRAVEEKEVSRSQQRSHEWSGHHQEGLDRASSIKRLCLMLVVFFLATFSLAAAFSPRRWQFHRCRPTGVSEQKVETPLEAPDFSSLLGATSPTALHEVLHKYFPETFRHGIFPSDRSAMEAVHRNDATLATSLVQLAKRDTSNSSTSSQSTTAPPPPPPTTTVVTTIETSAVSSTTQVSTITTTAAPSSKQPSTTPSSSPTPTITGTTTSTLRVSNLTSTSSMPVSSSSSLIAVISTFTTTNSNGVTVVTATSYVGVNPQGGAATSAPSGSLQNGGLSCAPPMLVWLVCAVAGGMALI